MDDVRSVVSERQTTTKACYVDSPRHARNRKSHDLHPSWKLLHEESVSPAPSLSEREQRLAVQG